jgi:hypothetical protein
MSDGGFYAMYNSGVVSGTTTGNKGWRAPEYGTVAPDRVWVDGPPQSGDVDTTGRKPQHENMLRAKKIPSGDVLFVEPNKLSSLKVTMEEWLTIPGYYNGQKIPAWMNDHWKEVFRINQLLNTDVSDLAQKMSNEQLQGFVSASGKKNPVIKNLYTRLHYDLKYPLSAEQALMIKVDPWPVKGSQLCAAQQRLAFAVVDEVLNMLPDGELLPLIGEKHKSLTQAGGPLAQNLHSVVIRSEEQATAAAAPAAPGPAAAAEPDRVPPPIPPFKPPIPAPEPAAPEPAQAQPPTARYISVFEGDSDSDQDGGGRKKTKRRKKTRKRKKTKRRKKTKKRKKSKRKTRKKRKKRKKTKRK